MALTNLATLPQTLRMAQAARPAPRAGEVLLKVLAIPVNAADWHSLRGKPLFSRHVMSFT